MERLKQPRISGELERFLREHPMENNVPEADLIDQDICARLDDLKGRIRAAIEDNQPDDAARFAREWAEWTKAQSDYRELRTTKTAPGVPEYILFQLSSSSNSSYAWSLLGWVSAELPPGDSRLVLALADGFYFMAHYFGKEVGWYHDKPSSGQELSNVRWWCDLPRPPA